MLFEKKVLTFITTQRNRFKALTQFAGLTLNLGAVSVQTNEQRRSVNANQRFSCIVCHIVDAFAGEERSPV